MKKSFLSALFLVIALAVNAQTSSEAIISSCPTMPSDGDIAQYIVKGENANVKKYFQQLGEANRIANKAALQEYSTKDFAKEQANVEKKQKQLQKKAANRVEAGKIMMKFLQGLTPAQRKKFESCRSEADAMQYLASIGKLDELHDLMEGVPGATGNDQVVDMKDMDLMRRDLSAEYEAVVTPMTEAGEKLSAYDADLKERAEKARQESIDAHKDNSGGKAGGLWDTEAVDNDMIGFWKSVLGPRKKLLLDYMQAIRNIIPIDKIRDKQKAAQRRMAGQEPLKAIESSEFSQAMFYLSVASQIFPGNDFNDAVKEMMEDNTQEINKNE